MRVITCIVSRLRRGVDGTALACTRKGRTAPGRSGQATNWGAVMELCLSAIGAFLRALPPIIATSALIGAVLWAAVCWADQR